MSEFESALRAAVLAASGNISEAETALMAVVYEAASAISTVTCNKVNLDSTVSFDSDNLVREFCVVAGGRRWHLMSLGFSSGRGWPILRWDSVGAYNFDFPDCVYTDEAALRAAFMELMSNPASRLVGKCI